MVTGRTRALGWHEGVLAMEGEIMMEKKREQKRKEYKEEAILLIKCLLMSCSSGKRRGVL